MLRVAIITDHSDFNEKVDGGVQAVTKYMIDAFTRIPEVDLHVLSFKYGISEGRTSAGSGYTRHTLPGARFGTLTGFWKDQQTLNRFLERIQPAIVHGQGAGQNGIVAARSKYPSVITIHGIMSEEARFYSGFGKRARHRLLSRLSEHYCIRHGKHTILISPYVAEYFENRLAGEHYLIPNPIGDGFFAIERREKPGRVLFAGRVYALKGVTDLIRAAARVAQSQKIELVLAGSLDDRQYVGQLKRESENLGISNIVQFRGLLGEQELREELSYAAVLALPSYQETAPMVIVEAMAAGVPVVATDIGGVAYLVRNGKTGFLIPSGDVNTLSERLITLLSDESLRQSFGTEARSLATEEYRADSVARKTIDVYRQILS
ncbi:MAG: glycosyltransferase family 4 protein [Woeseia sp.]